MTRKRPLTALVALVLATEACGGDSDPPPVPLSMAASAYARVFCEKVYTCCNEPDRKVVLTAGADEIACRTNVAAAVSTRVLLFTDSVAQKRAVWNEQEAGECFALYHSLACIDARTPPPVCKAFLVPMVAQGAACAQHYECIDGYCEGAVTDKKAGGCVSRKDMRAPCRVDAECKSGNCSALHECIQPALGALACGGGLRL